MKRTPKMTDMLELLEKNSKSLSKTLFKKFKLNETLNVFSKEKL